MIKFDVLRSPDFDLLGLHFFNFDQISVGAKNEDFIISDSAIEDLKFLLKIEEKNLLCIPSNTTTPYLINKKSFAGSRFLKKGDILRIGESEICIKDFQASEVDLMDRIASNKKLMDELSSDKKNLIEKVQNDLKKLI